MGKQNDPAAGRNGSEVGDATASWPHPDLKPLPVAVKPGHRYLSHTRFDGVEFEAPNTEPWSRRTVTVEVIATGPGWVDERTLTFNRWTRDHLGEPMYHPTWPPVFGGWSFEGAVAPRSSSWRRRRAVPR